ncbi:MAG: hypothetical protein N3G22_02770 [Candidatus Micrarchaeota archaeon]|nr:hypothetical protein [Candidatus Micrarchaeota archaeon]
MSVPVPKPMDIGEISNLIDSLIAPQEKERMIFLTDFPPGAIDEKRKAREKFLFRWYGAAQELASKKNFRLLPLVKYPETGKHNSELPRTAATHDGGHIDDLPAFISSANIAIAITEFSASAPLKNLSAISPNLRVVSMPGVDASMENAIMVDYRKMEERGKRLLAVVQNASLMEITFSGAGIPYGTKLAVDVRTGNWLLDSGSCKKKGDFTNLPAGELFAIPYEGIDTDGRARFGESQTAGIWPVYSPLDKKVAFLKVERNRIVRVQGDCIEAERIIEDIAQDENNANIAELGFGINEKARAGENIPILEREKAGPHLAYGRNDHFGSPATITGKVRASTHFDYVYSRETPISATIYAVYSSGKKVLIADKGKVVAV